MSVASSMSAEHSPSMHPGHHPSSKQLSELGVGIITSVALAATVIVLRIYTRIRIVKRVGPDDYLIVFAMLLCVGLMIVALEGTSHGWGSHAEGSSHKLFVATRYYSYIAQVLFVPITTLTKFSILYSYLRISPNRSFQNRVHFLIVWTALCSFSSCVALILRCTPIRAYWVEDIQSTICVNSPALILASGALNSATDLAVAILPAPMLWRANLPKRERAGLVLLFAIAGVVCVVGVARWGIYFDTTQIKQLDECTWMGCIAVMLGLIETTIGIIGASIPALRPLWGFYFGDRCKSEMINDNGSLGDSRKGGCGGEDAGQQDLEYGCVETSTGAFSYAATQPHTPVTNSKATTNPEASNSPQGGVSLRLFRNSESDMTLAKRLSRRLSIATGRASSIGGDDNESKRVPTGGPWLSLEDYDSERAGQLEEPSRFSEASTTVHSLDEIRNLPESHHNRAEANTAESPKSVHHRSPTPPLTPGIEINNAGGFCFAATAPTTPVLSTKSSKKSLSSTGGDCNDNNTQGNNITGPPPVYQLERRDIKRWVPAFTLPFRARPRGRTLDSTDTFELRKPPNVENSK